MMKMEGLWILDGHTPKPELNPLRWAEWFEEHDAERVVAQDKIGPYAVSTIFIGCDLLAASMGWAPRIFETAIFSPGDVDICPRYSTWEQAEKGHADAVARLRMAQNS